MPPFPPDQELTLTLQLQQGLAELQLLASESQVEKLLEYVAMLQKWNKVYNLTAVRKAEQIITRHILDSLVILPYLHDGHILDVGSGAGLPGIPLAIIEPQRNFTLLDSNSKKTRFLFQCKAELGLDNLEVIHSRVEEFPVTSPFTTIVSRAYSNLAGMIDSTHHLLAEGGIFLAMKGIYPVAELEDIPSGYTIESIDPLQVPGLDAERHVVIAKRA